MSSASKMTMFGFRASAAGGSVASAKHCTSMPELITASNAPNTRTKKRQSTSCRSIRRGFHMRPLLLLMLLGGAPHNREPGFGAPFAERELFQVGDDFKARRADRFDLPALGERVFEFPARYAPRAHRSRLGVAKAHEHHASPRVGDARQPLDVA